MLNRDFAPGFYSEHILKDLNIVLEEASKMNVDLKATKYSRDMYHEHVESGGGRDGHTGVLKTYEKKNNLQIQ